MQKQHLEDEVRWLQQMLAKEQQSKQAALGQLQDERAKCAMLEMEILHAAQAAQEMGESLCLFFNPCYQQSEQQVHQHMHPLICDDIQPNAEPVQQQEQQEVQSQEHEHQHAQQEVQQEPQQEQHSQAQSDLISNPDTAAHDQAHLRLREQAGLRSSADLWALQNEPLLAGPLKVSPGRRNSPRRLARSSPRRSLRISSSNSPMKQGVAAVGSAAQMPAAASAATSSQHLQSNKEACCETAQQGLAAAEGSTADLPTDTDHKVVLDQHREELEVTNSAQQQRPKQEPELQQQQAETESDLNEASVEASSDAVVTPGMAAALHQQDGAQRHQTDRVQDHLAAAAATLAAAAAVAAGQGSVQATMQPSRQGKAGQSPFSAAAAAAAAIQQSVSAASAAIAAAEAARGKGCPQVQAGPIVLLSPFGSVLSDTPGGRVCKEAAQASEDCDTASSSSSGSGKGCTSHALPHSIVADPATAALEVEHSSTQPDKKSGSTAAENAGQDQQQQQQQPPSSAQGKASSLCAAASLPSSNASAAPADMNEAKPSSSSTSTATTNSNSCSRSRSNGSRPVTPDQENSLQKPAAADCQVPGGPTEHESTAASSGTQLHRPEASQELQSDASAVPPRIPDASAQLSSSAEAVAEAAPACVHPMSAGLDSGRHTNSSAGKGSHTDDHPEPHSPAAAAPNSTADATGALDSGMRCSAVEQSTAGSEQVLPAGMVRPSASSSDGIQCSNSSIKHEQVMPAAIQHQQQQEEQEPQQQQQLAWQSRMHQQAAVSSLAASKAFGQDSTARTPSSMNGRTWSDTRPPSSARLQPGRTLQQQHGPTGFFSDRLPAQSQAQPRGATHRQADAWQQPQKLQQYRQAGRSSQQPLPCKDVAAANLQPLLPRPQSLHKSAVSAAAAAANGSTAHLRAMQPAAAAAVMHTGQKQVCMQGVDGGAAAEFAPSSCLSPLHWHQANLGSSRPGFYQAMVSQHRCTTGTVQTGIDTLLLC